MKRAKRHAYIGVGSNSLPAPHISAGLAALARQFGDLTLSATYESVSSVDPGVKFWNLVVAFQTGLNWSELRAQLKSIEDRCGRTRGAAAAGVVTLDLDLLLLTDGDDADESELPLHDLRRAGHVLAPLAELLPDWRHPEAGVTLAELWAAVAPHVAELTPVALTGYAGLESSVA